MKKILRMSHQKDKFLVKIFYNKKDKRMKISNKMIAKCQSHHKNNYLHSHIQIHQAIISRLYKVIDHRLVHKKLMILYLIV